MSYDADVIVVGSGAGGGTFASACARAGKSVLLLERGRVHRLDSPVHDERAMLVDRKPYDDRTFEVNGSPRHLYLGGILGGSTSLYGAALLRPSRDDFHPGLHYGRRLPRPIWDWPCAYDTLAPYYDRAESLYGVAGCADEDLAPLEKPGHGYPAAPLPLHPLNRKLIDRNRAHGLRPFRLPLAIDPDRCLRCHACAGYVCPNGSRRSSVHLVEQAIADRMALRVVTNVEVESLCVEDGRVTGVRVLDRATGARTIQRGRRYVLAAGAIGSPLLLLRSGIDGPHVGRHYAYHLSPIVVGIFPGRTGGDETFVKQVGFADFYLGTREFPHKLGLVQSLPVPGPLLMARSAPRWLPGRIVEMLRRRMLPLVACLEDLPDPGNHVACGPDGRPRLFHRFSAYDRERGRYLAGQMGRILRRAGALFCLTRQFASEEHVAHQCGTLRFGTDPAHAVLDPECRLFQHPNVFVVDGSFMPTSLGVGPALTIIANALRVADVVTREL